LYARRWDPIGSLVNAVRGLLKKDNASQPEAVLSLQEVQQSTREFVLGKVPAKKFAGVLTAAFGPTLNKVLPEIFSSMPKNKADELRREL
jgi:hypothetical protein